MPVFLEYGLAGTPGGGVGVAMQLEGGSSLLASETLASGSTSTIVATTDGVMTLTPTVDGYAAFGNGTLTPSVNPRRRLLSGIRMTFGVLKGDKVAWSEV